MTGAEERLTQIEESIATLARHVGECERTLEAHRLILHTLLDKDPS